MNLEIGHVNLSVKSEAESKAELEQVGREIQGHADDEGIAGCPWENDKPIVGWHTDSYPFVCVLMLSDCTNMVGGETALRTGNGDVLKVRGPQMVSCGSHAVVLNVSLITAQGCAVVMQGRYITHQALRALGAQERITMVTSFRPRSPHVRDDTVLTTVRPISDLSRLYYEFASYRLAMLEERVRTQMKDLRETYDAGKRLDTRSLKKFLEDQEGFLWRTNKEIVLDEQVIVGHLPEVDSMAKVDDTGSSNPAKRRKKA